MEWELSNALRLVKKYLKLAFLCSVEVWKFVSFLGHFGSFLAKKPKNDKNTPQNTLKSPILSKFQIGPDFSIFIVWSCYYARWKAQTWYFLVVPGPDMTKILSFRQKAKTSARKCLFGHFSNFYPKMAENAFSGRSFCFLSK